MRKGSATYSSSGSTACPSSTAIHLRAGWSLGGVQDTYMRYESAGDMFVGRTVSGLPSDKPEFAVLPPRFTGEQSNLHTAINLCFPGIPSNLRLVAEFTLASVVYHVDFLRATLPSTHTIFSTVLFCNSELLNSLSMSVSCDGDDLVATGVPPHVTLLRDLKVLSNKIDANIKQQEANVSKMIEGVVQELEQRAISAGTVTQQGLHESLLRCLEEAGVMRVVQMAQEPPTQTSSILTQQSESIQWAGLLHSNTREFTLPRGTPSQAWLLWTCGNTVVGYPPLRNLPPRAMPTENMRKRLSDLKFLMKKVETEAKRIGMWMPQFSPQQAIDVYEQCCNVIAVPSITEKRRERRCGQLTWMSIVDLLRRQQRVR